MKLIIYTAIFLAMLFSLAPFARAQETKVDIPGIPNNIPMYNSNAEQAEREKTIEGLKLGDVSPNELKGYEFFGSGRLKGLRLGVSDRQDVIKIFGKSCEKICSYNDKWSIAFTYFRDGALLPLNGKAAIVILPQYAGKIHRIYLYPKKKTFALEIKFSDEFNLSTVSGTSLPGKKPGMTFETYADGYGLSYEIANKTVYKAEKDKETYSTGKGAFWSIQYGIPIQIEKTMFVEQYPNDK
jgi:hypothetical protein